MSQNQSKFEYQIGGSLGGDAPSYVARKADEEFYQRLKAGEFCYVLNSRQMGKSSLRVRTMQKLQADGICCGFIDLTGIGTETLTPPKWYAGIIQALVSSCQLNDQLEWRKWWRERTDLLSPVQLLNEFITEVLLKLISVPIVIFVDEIDHIISQNFCLDDFFALIRYCFEQRAVNTDYQRLTWTLLGVATPSDLIKDKAKTPFNLGTPIELKGFELDEVQPLITGLQGKIDNPEAVMIEILHWTGGQPFLTQKLCELVTNYPQNISIAEIVETCIITNWESADEPEHLRTIRDRLLLNQNRIGGLLGLYEQILQHHAIDSVKSPLERELKLSGLVVEQKGKIRVYNPIYELIFDQKWVDHQLANLRPYSHQLTAWIDSNCLDESHLLQGQTLQDALTWSLGKSLGEQDYQFLGASQDLAKRQVQNTLAMTEQASECLAQIHKKVNRDLYSKRLGRGWLGAIACLVTAFIIILRSIGLLQGSEWNLYDQFLRWRSLEPLDERIVIVTIDESDLRFVKQYPVPDGILAQAIAIINKQNPRAIGLDIYRDLPVEPGHEQLKQIFESTPNLFGIEKVVENGIAPPPILSQKQQVGFADQVVDSDGKVRRGLLFIWDDSGKVWDSLAVKLAIEYLEKDKISPEQSKDDPNSLRLGKAIFKRFERNDGGYVNAQSGGYQLLINFRGDMTQFKTFSLQQVLNNQIPPHSFQDRLVLIGTTAESVNDFLSTPYTGESFRSPKRMAGIVLHANIVSHILSAAMDGRTLWHTWDESLEWLWIGLWGFMGAVISWYFKSLGVILLVLVLLGAGLLGLCYLGFLWGWWLPVVPAMLSFLGSAILLMFITLKRSEKIRFQCTLSLLLELYRENPPVGRIAIEYFKHSETLEHQKIIESKLKRSL